ncbi:phosphofructokinase [Dermatophagoides farinae]|uniref:6-phosphofructokinase n=1 Tax=Dermatophagoides farinae TaxID=6954 RepID=A0A9D4NXP6_DERFA|nr:ATP-dependent 6-phosphofructokinase, liver type-like [Dermatophagoides farinae]KAH7640024.1 phosphofructokinase [Dermatophagoides farinae]
MSTNNCNRLQSSSNDKSIKSTSNKSKRSSTSSNIAVLTSGGDCQGMNSVLYGLTCHHIDTIMATNNSNDKTELYLVYNGYQGLIDGSSRSIISANLKILHRHLYQGGTIINSSRCREFYHQDGRRKAAYNLLRLNIQNLIIIGGDGSLTGANHLRREWPQFVKELIDKGEFDSKNSNSQLNLIGIIGSIDNDFFGSEMTIGTDSALARVVESIDALKTTAKSHSRAIVVEVMGRNCGYLAISTALATQASYVFIPEYPHRSTDEWQKKLAARLQYERNNGQYYHIVIIAEGACDNNGDSIKSNQIKDYLNKDCNIETRLIILGHLQRGGYTSAFDHLMSMSMGIKAYDMIRMKEVEPTAAEEKETADDKSSSYGMKQAIILTLNNGQIQSKPLSYCIDEMAKLTRFVRERNWPKVMEYRGVNFINTWENYRNLMSPPSKSALSIFDRPKSSTSTSGYCWAIMICSSNHNSPMPGTNGILFALVRYGQAQNITVIGYRNGLEGLYGNDYQRFEWQDVADITSISGSIIGSQSRSRKSTPRINDENIERIITNLQMNKIKFLCFVGDHQAFDHLQSLNEYRKRFDYLLDMKLCYIPVSAVDFDIDNDTNSNDNDSTIVWSKLGRDSMMNKTIRLICDLIYSTQGTYNQLFMIRINLDMLSSTTFIRSNEFAMAVGAAIIYPKDKSNRMEPPLHPESIKTTAIELRESILQTNENKFVIIHYPLWSKIQSIFMSIIAPFSDRIRLNSIDMTAMQMPTHASPFDRKLGVKLGMECGRYFSNANFETTPLMISTPFLYEARPIKSRIRKSK